MATTTAAVAAPATPAAAKAANGSIAAAPIAPATNPMVTPLLTDQYQFTMAYAYWKAGKHLERAVFDLFFRKNPFGGEFTVFGGLEECIRFLANFKFKEEEISFLRSIMPRCEEGFFEYLKAIDCSDVEVYAISEGSVVFPKVPLMRVEGPVAVVQLLETPFVNLVNYASLVTTNAARHRLVAGKSKSLLEFGLRRAQGPDGGISASKYCYVGGFDATSNVAAGRLFGIPLRGTHSHAFVSSFMSLDEIVDKALLSHDGSRTCDDFVSLVQNWLSKLQWTESLRGVFGETNQSELAAFTSYALAFPDNFLALVDTYDVMRSGLPNFCAVALALNDLGYKASGIRLDSGDLAYLSIECRKFFCSVEKEFKLPGFGKTIITASNDLNEETLDHLNKQGHEVDSFGIGTYLVTCYTQAALGCVFKLVEINNQPRMKLSEDVSKVSIPCRKQCYRLYGKEGYPLVDIMTGENEPPPKAGERILCRHPFNESKRAYVVPQRVDELLKCYWPGDSHNKREELPSLKKIRVRCTQQLEQMRPDHMRRLNPTPYKVSVSAKLYDFIHFLWLNEAPVGSATLTYLYRQLGEAGKKKTMSITGYLTLLEITFNPHAAHRQGIPDTDLFWYSGCVHFGAMAEPHYPDRVLSQFGYIQTIPREPMRPTRVKLGVDARNYTLVYLNSTHIWESWEDHMIGMSHRGKMCTSDGEAHKNYLSWFHPRTHQTVTPPHVRYSSVDRVLDLHLTEIIKDTRFMGESLERT